MKYHISSLKNRVFILYMQGFYFITIIYIYMKPSKKTPPSYSYLSYTTTLALPHALFAGLQLLLFGLVIAVTPVGAAVLRAPSPQAPSHAPEDGLA